MAKVTQVYPPHAYDAHSLADWGTARSWDFSEGKIDAETLDHCADLLESWIKRVRSDRERRTLRNVVRSMRELAAAAG